MIVTLLSQIKECPQGYGGTNWIARASSSLADCVGDLTDRNGSRVPKVERITGQTPQALVAQCCRIASMPDLPLEPRLEQLTILWVFVNGHGIDSRYTRALVTEPFISTSVKLVTEAMAENWQEQMHPGAARLYDRITSVWYMALKTGKELGLRDAAVQAVESEMLLYQGTWSLTAPEQYICMSLRYTIIYLT